MQDFDGTFELVPVDEINIDPKYQRVQKWDLIGAIADNPTWVAFGVVICSRREYAGGKLYALDGQQRLNGVMTAKNPPSHVPVFWFPVKSEREEAEYFDLINTNRKTMQALEKFKARVTAENTTYLRIAAAIEQAGYSLGGARAPKTIAAVGALETIYNAVGEEGVYLALASYTAAWPDEDSPTATMLTAFADVMGEMSANGGLTLDRLEKGLAKTTPGRLMRKAEDIRYKQGGTKRVALRKAFKELAKL